MPLSFTDLAVDVAEADDYVTARGYAGWTGTDPAKLAALRRGQDYIAAAYNALWAEDFDNDDAPYPVIYAIVEAARRELTSPGSLSPDYVAANAVQRISKQVGSLKKDVEYAASGSAGDVAPVISLIEGLLADLIVPKRTPAVLVV